MGAESARLRRVFKEYQRIRTRPTREGAWMVALVIGIAIAAVNTGNNLAYFVLSTLLSTLLIQGVMGEANLRGLRVERRLPEELFAYEGADGAFILVNERPRVPALGVEVVEVGEGEARSLFGVVGAGERLEAPATWTFGARGEARLGRVRLSSRWPFGLFERSMELDLASAVLVYPARRRGGSPTAPDGAGQGAQEGPRAGGGGDLMGLRPYVPGDPIRRIHWPSSARFGQPMLALRAAEQAEVVLVKVEGGPRVEEQLARACGLVCRHTELGHAVGLALPGAPIIAPLAGQDHRRRLLAALARWGPT